MSVWCECWRRSRPRCAPPLAGSRGRPGLRAPCGCAEHMAETGWGWDSAGSRTARAGDEGLAGGAGWWCGRARMLACSLGGSAVGSGRLRGSDGPGRACLARWGLRVTVCAWSVCVA